MTLLERAPAKINLYLHVVGKREDGYHLLESLVVLTDIYDTVAITGSDRLNLHLNGDFADAISTADNIVLNAAKTLARYADIPPNVQITLTKNIPVGAGLGGGSSDAAAVLRALIRFWEIDISPKTLLEIALSLGADVPVLLYNQAAFISGIGEHVKCLTNFPPTHTVLVNPGVHVSTPEVFKKGVAHFSPSQIHTPEAICQMTGKEWEVFLQHHHNDLEAPAKIVAPVISEVLASITDQPSCLLARMSGSGATCFGLFTKKSAAHKAALSIKTQHPNWWVKETLLR